MKDYALGLYEKAMPESLSWKEKFDAAKQAGYDFIEISIDESDQKLIRLNYDWDQREEIRRISETTGIPIRSMCLSAHRRYPLGSSDPNKEKMSLMIMEKAIHLAEDLGIRVIMLAGYDVYYEKSDQKTKERFNKNLKEAVQMASKAGVLLGFETMETEFMCTVKKAMEVVELIDSPYLGVYPDSGNITNAAIVNKDSVIDDLKYGKGHLVGLHLKETVPGIFREIPYGSGHVDFRSIATKAWELGIRRYVTEFWYTGNPDWKKELIETRALMGDLLDEVQEEYRQNHLVK